MKYAIVPWILWDVTSLKFDEWIPKNSHTMSYHVIPRAHMTALLLKVFSPPKKNAEIPIKARVKFGFQVFEKNAVHVPHRIHVWHIYLHLP